MKKPNDNKYLKFYRFEINLGRFKRERDFGSNLLPFSFGIKLSCAFPLMRVCSLVKCSFSFGRVGTMQSLFITRRVGVFWYETSLDQSIFLTLFRSMFTPGQKCLRWQKPGARLQTLECMRRAKANSSTPLRLMPFVHLDIK